MLALVALAVFMLAFPLVGCETAGPSLDPPDSIVVYSDGAESRYTEGDREYGAAFDLLKGTRLDVVLETAIDPETETALKDGDCIELVYDAPQRISFESKGSSAAREYDRLLFCFTGPVAGEVVMGLDGQYLSGTYEMGTTAWPY